MALPANRSDDPARNTTPNCGPLRCSTRDNRVRSTTPGAHLLATYSPRLAIIPVAYQIPHEDDPHAIDAYADPLPLVVEVWSPSTGGYDLGTKLRGYQGRGDEEIWYLHPYERTLTVWRRQPDGSYDETVSTGGTVEPATLPGVAVELDELFAD
jgi:Uma2 family endonuclease